ncbi:MAG TPA: Uma2 family endonuclease, partial [Kofleriaceae bacterium]|nr:Uma2 family endonuclease [Kofleriaceae bacterium]
MAIESPGVEREPSGPSELAGDLPGIDERLVEPETRYEMLEGRLVYVSPADAPHGTRHSKLAALLEVHAGLEYQVAADMLTRTSRTSDIAPDVSVFPSAPDPVTGKRQLQHLAFEVVSTQSLGYAGRKAAQLAGRGVRRVFAIDVERSQALEWSAVDGKWQALDPAGVIEDPALDVALPVGALLDTAKADDAVARALLAKGNAVLARDRAEAAAAGRAAGEAAGRAAGEAAGRAEGKAEAVIVLLAARGIAVDEAS